METINSRLMEILRRLRVQNDTVTETDNANSSETETRPPDDDWSVLYYTYGRPLREEESSRHAFSQLLSKQRREQHGDVDDSASDGGIIRRLSVLAEVLSEHISERALIVLIAEFSPGFLSQTHLIGGVNVDGEQHMNRAIASATVTVDDCRQILRVQRVMIEYASHDQGWADHGRRGTASTSATELAVQTVSYSGRVTEIHRGQLANNDTANSGWQRYRFVFNADQTSVMDYNNVSDARIAQIYSAALPWYNYHMTTINKMNEAIQRMRESAQIKARTEQHNDDDMSSGSTDDECCAVELVLIGRSVWPGWTFSCKHVQICMQYVLTKPHG